MEIKYAQSIVAGPDPWALVKRFPFYPNYLELAGMEYKGANLTPEDRVVFLGSGPLPLSTLSISLQLTVSCSIAFKIYTMFQYVPFKISR